MTVDKWMPDGTLPTRELWNCAYSGATGQDILDHQLLNKPESDSVYGLRSVFASPRMATLTAGGDDIEFLSLMWYCIYEFSSPSECSQQIVDSTTILRSGRWKNTRDAPASGAGFRLFVTGYAQFFNSETPQYNDVTFTYWKSFRTSPRKLTNEIRKTMNNLAKELNQHIEKVVADNLAAIFVDYDARFQSHRFCEPGVVEPDVNNPNIWFFHLGTDGNDRTALDQQLMAKLDPKNNAHTFAAALKDPTQQGHGVQPKSDADAYGILLSASDRKDASTRSDLSGLIRGFYPTRPGIDAIVDEVFKKLPDWRRTGHAATPQLAALPTSTVTPFNPPSQPSCYPKPTQHYQDAHTNFEHTAAWTLCEQVAKSVRRGKIDTSKDEQPLRHPENDAADDHCNLTITSIPGCSAPAGYDLQEPIRGIKCPDLVYNA
ncbi:hypothetical protein MMC17_009247 [Xylographa soralifera]|nr:hypothetical protein [Xylographa soralifera]